MITPSIILDDEPVNYCTTNMSIMLHAERVNCIVLQTGRSFCMVNLPIRAPDKTVNQFHQ